MSDLRGNVFNEIMNQLRDEISKFGKGRILDALEPGEQHTPEGKDMYPHEEEEEEVEE